MNSNQIYNQSQMMPPPMPSPKPHGKGSRWGKMLMSGAAIQMRSLPSWFASYALGTYVIALLGVNLINSSYAMEWYFWLFGIVWVGGFFLLSVKYSRDWSVMHIRKRKVIEKKIFLTGLLIRVVYAIFIYAFYSNMTGLPHEYAAADSISYIETATDFSAFIDYGIFGSEMSKYLQTSFSDAGYPLLILPLIRWFGADAVFMILIINALIGAYTAVVVYRLVDRCMDETTARIAAIFCMLHPTLICYVGMTLKEVFMTFITLLFVDLAERMLRERKYTFATIAPMVLVGLSLFLFRTVLGIIAFMALFFALVMMDSKIVSFGKKFALGTLIAGILLMSASENIKYEIEQITNTNVRELQEISMTKRYGEEKDNKGTGNRFAKYAGAAVFAPLIFTIPFPTMVKAIEGQEDMRLIHGGNWMRNVMSGFVILAMFILLLSGDWRKYALPLAIMLGYLLMLAFTPFAHSLRFHIPVMPFEMMFAAYAITNMRKKHKNWYLIWCLVMVVACFAWNWFKLAGRGLA